MLTNEEYVEAVNERKECCPICYHSRIVEHIDRFPKHLECTACHYKWENVFGYVGNKNYKLTGYALYRR